MEAKYKSKYTVVNQRLKSRLDEIGKSKTALYKELGVTRQAVNQRLERTEFSEIYADLKLWADYAESTVEELFGSIPKEKE